MNRHVKQSLAGVVAALVWLAGCSIEQPVPSTTPTPSDSVSGLRVTPIATIPAVHVPADLRPVAGTGTRFLIEGETNDDPGRYSLDNGRTWQDAPAELSVRSGQGDLPLYGSFIGYGGVFLGVRQEPEPSYAHTGFQRWDPVTGQVVTLEYDLDREPEFESDDDTPVFPIDFIGTLVLLDDSRIFDVSGSSALPVEPRLPDSPGLEEANWAGITRDGRYVVGMIKAGPDSRLVLGGLTADATPTTVAVPGLLDVDVSADRIHYLVHRQGRLSACRAEAVTATAASCTVVTIGGPLDRRFSAVLSTSDGAAQITLVSEEAELGDDRSWFVRGGRVALLARSHNDWAWLPYRDTEAPMARQNGVAVTISDGGVASPLFSAPAEEALASGLAVAADRVVYRQESTAPTGTRWPIWTRALAGRDLSDPVLLVDRTVVAPYVSGDRTAVQWDRDWEDGENDIVFYDQLTQTGSAAAAPGPGLRALSGPYARIGDQVIGVDGHHYDTGPVMAHFGSLVVEASDAKEAPGRSFAVRDLTLPDAEPTPIDLPDTAGRTYHNAGWRIWGDWVAASHETESGFGALLLNHRTGEVVDLAGRPVLALGDGWVLLLDGSTERMWLRGLATGEEVEVAEWSDVVTDGVRTLAWSGPKDAVVATIEGLSSPVPRLLGTLGASEFRADGEHPWTPEFDLTGPTGSGTLELVDAAGLTVAGLPVDASTSGSIRGLRWDGTDADGEPVEPGEYTWTLKVDDATSLDGQRPASGTLVITR